MCHMKRKIYQQMLEWKRLSSGKSALMLDGARRVGKSWIAEEFAKREYQNYLLIDFSTASPDVKGYFVNYLDDLDVFFMYLLGAYHVTLERGKSVIIFDEVQEFPRAREAIKCLVKDGRYHYIETGSLISIRKNVKKILLPSEEHHLKMFPMDFDEFLCATGNETLIPVIEHAYRDMTPVGAGMHRRLMDLLRQYEIVGGMPQVVAEFVQTHDLTRVDREKRDILELYRGDILKHGGASKYRILAVFNGVASALARHEWKFSPGTIKDGSGMREYETAFEWLKSSMTVNVAYRVTEPSIGLELSSDHSSLKCYLGDTGLLVSMAFAENELFVGDVQQRILTGRLEVNEGLIVENLVGQMIRVAGNELYYFSTYSRQDSSQNMEIDFLIARSGIQRRHNVIPIEVKSAGHYTTKSLDKFATRYRQQVSTPIVLHTKDVERKGDRIALPLYMAPLIGR